MRTGIENGKVESPQSHSKRHRARDRERERESAIESIVGFRMSKLSRSLAYLSDTSSAIARCAMIHAEFGDSETETETKTENESTQVLLKHKQHLGFSTGFFCCFVDLAAWYPTCLFTVLIPVCHGICPHNQHNIQYYGLFTKNQTGLAINFYCNSPGPNPCLRYMICCSFEKVSPRFGVHTPTNKIKKKH